MKMKGHYLFEQPPLGYRAWLRDASQPAHIAIEDWIFLPLPVYWIVKGKSLLHIWIVRNITAPCSRLRRFLMGVKA